jgi:hypothetical protein
MLLGERVMAIVERYERQFAIASLVVLAVAALGYAALK